MAGMESLLQPFEERAAKAEERLARLEDALNSLDEIRGEQPSSYADGMAQPSQAKLLSELKELRSHLGRAQTEQQEIIQQRNEATKEKDRLMVENAKLQYRVLHLVRAVKEGDERIEQLTAGSKG